MPPAVGDVNLNPVKLKPSPAIAPPSVEQVKQLVGEALENLDARALKHCGVKLDPSTDLAVIADALKLLVEESSTLRTKGDVAYRWDFGFHTIEAQSLAPNDRQFLSRLRKLIAQPDSPLVFLDLGAGVLTLRGEGSPEEMERFQQALARLVEDRDRSAGVRGWDSPSKGATTTSGLERDVLPAPVEAPQLEEAKKAVSPLLAKLTSSSVQEMAATAKVPLDRVPKATIDSALSRLQQALLPEPVGGSFRHEWSFLPGARGRPCEKFLKSAEDLLRKTKAKGSVRNSPGGIVVVAEGSYEQVKQVNRGLSALADRSLDPLWR